VSDRRATGQGGGPIRGGRRAFLRAVGAGSVALEAGLSGCLDRFSGDDSDGDDGPPDAEPTLFADDFEEASMADDVTRDLPINADGFVWRSNNRTAIVRDELPDGGCVVWENGPVDEFVEAADYRTRDGEHALRFRYPPEESWAEQRFAMNEQRVGYDVVWIGYWIRVPQNFEHASGSDSPSNNKWLAVWMDGYSQHGTGATAVFNTWSSEDREPGTARATISASNAQPVGHRGGIEDFIVPSRDQGRWMYTVHRLERGSEPGVADGSAHWWRQWADAEAPELGAGYTDYVFDPPDDPSAPRGGTPGTFWGGRTRTTPRKRSSWSIGSRCRRRRCWIRWR
jgi:hypothetical protein